VLKPEEAEKRLKQFKIRGKEDPRLARVGALPGALKEAAYALLARDPQGKRLKEYDDQSEAKRRAVAALEGMDAGERLRVWEALLPLLAAHVEGGWQLHDRLPYPVSSAWSEEGSPAYRAPGHPEVLREPRTAWIDRLLDTLEGYEQDVRWVAAWAAHLGYWAELGLIPLLAAAIDAGGEEGEEVFEILLASARGEHEIGEMCDSIIGAFLAASRPEGWEFLERMLLAAQRQEGLRQSILEGVHSGHPGAFRHLLRVILEHDLLRFSAAIKAADVWFGFQLDVMGAAAVRRILSRVQQFLDAPGDRASALDSADPEERYLALWSIAFEDAFAAIPPAAAMLQDPQAEHRFAAAHLLSQLDLPEAKEPLRPLVDDADLRVALAAVKALTPGYLYFGYGREEEPAPIARTEMFERLERLVARLPAKKQPLPPIVWPWAVFTADRQQIGDVMAYCLGDRPPQRLIPHLGALEPQTRAYLVELLAKQLKSDSQARETLFTLVGDPAETVRTRALGALAKAKIRPEEAQGLERLLTRKAGELRRGVLSLLLGQPNPAALASADRLLAAKDALQRLAGLEILAELSKAERAPAECRGRAEAYRAARAQRSDEEEERLRPLLVEVEKPVTLDDALGLMDPAARTPVSQPREVPGVELESDTAQRLLKSLDALIKKYRQTTVRVRGWDGEEREELLENLGWRFPEPNGAVGVDEDAPRLPLREVWEAWYQERPAELRDPDGFELLRAAKRLDARESASERAFIAAGVIDWLLRLHPPVGAVDFLLDAVETSFARIPPQVVAKRPKKDEPWDQGWRGDDARMAWLTIAREYRDLHPAEWEDRHHTRLWHILRWLDEPGPPMKRLRAPVEEAAAAWAAGAATDADLFDLLLGPREVSEEGRFWSGSSVFEELHEVSGRRCPLLERYPGLQALVQRCRERVMEIELRRGDLPSTATVAALALRYAGGAEALVRLLEAMGTIPFVRGWIRDDLTRGTVFSHLIRVTHPGREETPAAFAARVQSARIPEKRLIEVAVYAPQWAPYVEAAVGWDGLTEGVWWLHAHTKDTQWRVEDEIRTAWAAQVAERTPLTAEELMDGAVDVAWFHRVYGQLGEKRWKALDDAAKYASGGGGHKRAQLFAGAMQGRADREQLLTQIREKRNQDALRALGLLPLPAGPDSEAEVLARYHAIQEFLRGSRQFGSQRQVSEKLAASIAMENLARTAGYPDPMRLEWAMEARAIADLAEGALTAAADDVTVTLSIDPWGAPDLKAVKNGKPLKAIPPAAKKAPEIAALVERSREVGQQFKRMRLSLSRAMCRGDRFTGAELRGLMAHPVLAPMLRSLVFLGERGAGYPVEGEQALESHDERVRPLHDDDSLRIAHPHDLLLSGEWHHWQRDCLRRERIQPFKQVFRELYVLTDAEREARTHSHRYAGHQIQGKQAMALLGGRGWVSDQEEGEVRRTFHDEGLTAWIDFDYGWTTPAEVEGMAVESVHFTKRGQWEALPLEEIPPRIFSEVMRDVDLIVSVAHAGGVDPEATASTVEMRAALVRETCALLRLENVRLGPSHALIDGQRGSYSVHLGSGVVHRQPGGHVCIVPVHGQHRGRLFLPFADDDPKSAEVLSKVLLLAKDSEIQDPTILAQLR
jgi:Trp operon repressor